MGGILKRFCLFFMNGLLAKLLKKKKIDSLENLSLEEQTTFDNYEKILSKEKLNIDDLKSFLQIQISNIESKWKDYNLEQIKKAELIPYHTVYKAILQAIDAPLSEREALEKFLNQQLQ